jgi:hypothetical protein
MDGSRPPELGITMAIRSDGTGIWSLVELMNHQMLNWYMNDRQTEACK